MKTQNDIFNTILNNHVTTFDPKTNSVKIDETYQSVIPDYKQKNATILLSVMYLIKERENPLCGTGFINLLTWAYWNWLPDYFFRTPASSTGKYHPAYANKINGLMLHSLATARYANSLLDLTQYDNRTKNMIITAAWHHDMFKYGNPETYQPKDYTVHEHPIIAADFFAYDKTIAFLSKFNIAKDECVCISDMIRTHNGPYTRSNYSDIILPEPETLMQKIIYKSDYFASRKEDDIIKDII